jgi:competence protein ComEA
VAAHPGAPDAGEPDSGSAVASADRRDEVEVHGDRPSARELFDALIERARVRLRWIGPGRLAGAIGALLVIAGVAWWLLRTPALPTEAALPLATAAPAGNADGGRAATTTTLPTPVESPEPPTVVVHVTGAVNRPGVYTLAAGERVDDALAAAGGATAAADPNVLNLAAPLADGDRIEVPVLGAADASASSGAGHTHATAAGSEPDAGMPIDLNVATADDLEQLAGIGPATAAAIVEHRNQHGPFSAVDQLLDVPGIGPAKLDAIRDSVTT